MRNNKITRKKAQKLYEQNFVKQVDGTEVLQTKDARRKLRRWTFEADIDIIVPETKLESGEVKPAMQLPRRTVKLDSVSYGTAKDARENTVIQKESLHKSTALFQNANIIVRAIPHETVSVYTFNQLNGYRDMAMILDRALELSVKEAQDVVCGRSVGSQFVEIPATEAEGDNPAKPAKTTITIKEDFYSRALKGLTPTENLQNESVPIVQL